MTDNELLGTEIQNTLGSPKKPLKNFPEFEKLVHLLQYDPQGFIVKNIESELTQANNQSEE